MPRATVLLQLDEPGLPAVIAGHVPTESGLSVYRAVDGPDAATGLRTVTGAVGVPVIVHCCAPDVPLQVVRDAQAAAVGLDLSLVKDLDPLGELLEAGLGLFAGAAATRPPGVGVQAGRGECAESLEAAGVPGRAAAASRLWSRRPVGWRVPPGRSSGRR